MKNKWKVVSKLLPLGLKMEVTKDFIKSGSPALWPLFEENKIPGFGIQLARFLFPIYRNYDGSPEKSSTLGDIASQNISTFFSQYRNSYKELLPEILAWKNRLQELPVEEVNEEIPFLNNEFYSILEASILGCILTKYRPQSIFEIGSGISTRFCRYIISSEGLLSKLISIDPEPRKSIKKVCDEIIPSPLEDVIHEIKKRIKPGDLVFMDGSHYVFPNNDTTSFFLDLLPSLPSGVIIHIHDIHLPNDYPTSGKKHLWGEQYLLASMILGGFKGFEVLFPTSHVLNTEPELRQSIQLSSELENKGVKVSGSSFWMLKA